MAKIQQDAGKTKTNRPGLLVNLSLVTLSTIFALFLIELVLRLIGFSPLYVSPERDRFWRYDPLLGWAHQPGQEGIFETPEFRTFVRINESGLRDREHTYERQNDLQRILVLGDSFAWGYGVEESERFSQRLEDVLEVEVINAGVSGYSTDQELLWYRTEGIKYETDLVILVVTGNDVGDNDRQLVSTIYYKPKFIIEEGQLVSTGHPVPETNLQGKIVYFLSQRSSLIYFLVQRYFDALSIYGEIKNNPVQVSPPVSGVPAAKEPFKLTMALIDEIRNITVSNGAEFMIVTTDHWWNLPSDATYTDFVAALQDGGYLVLDVESMPGFDPEKMLIPDDGHWNRSGHEYVADRIKEFIKMNQFLHQP